MWFYYNLKNRNKLSCHEEIWRKLLSDRSQCEKQMTLWKGQNYSEELGKKIRVCQRLRRGGINRGFQGQSNVQCGVIMMIYTSTFV
jgi:hypothetical protein